MNLDDSRILDSTSGNGSVLHFSTVGLTVQGKRKQQSEAMFADLQRIQSQKCEMDFAKNQHILRNVCALQNDFSKSADLTDEPNLTVCQFSPPNSVDFTYSPGDENGSIGGEIFVFTVKNIEKIANILNLDNDKLKDLFIKVIKDEEVNDEFLTEMNSKIRSDSNVTQFDVATNVVYTLNKSSVLNQSTRTIEEYKEVCRPSDSSTEYSKRNGDFLPKINNFIEENLHSHNDYIQVRPPQATQENLMQSTHNLFSIRNKNIYDQVTQPNNELFQKRSSLSSFSRNPIEDPCNISAQLISIADAVLHNTKPADDIFGRNKYCNSPDLFSDDSSSGNDVIPQS